MRAMMVNSFWAVNTFRSGDEIPSGRTGFARLVAASRSRVSTRSAGKAIFNDLQGVSLVELHACGSDNGAQRTRGASLLTNHLAQISLGHSQFQHCIVTTCNRFY